MLVILLLKNHHPTILRSSNNLSNLDEASQLAGDFERLCENEFPSQAMAEFLTRHSDAVALEQRKQLIHLTK